MNRRGFLGGILAASMAPAIVRADSLMRVIPMEAGIVSGFAAHARKGGIFAGDTADFVEAPIDWFTGAIRELSCYDIVSDAIVVRHDVMLEDVFGQRIQKGIDSRVEVGRDVPSVRDAALAALKANIEATGGLRPVHGALRIPSGFPGDKPFNCNQGRFL